MNLCRERVQLGLWHLRLIFRPILVPFLCHLGQVTFSSIYTRLKKAPRIAPFEKPCFWSTRLKPLILWKKVAAICKKKVKDYEMFKSTWYYVLCSGLICPHSLCPHRYVPVNVRHRCVITGKVITEIMPRWGQCPYNGGRLWLGRVVWRFWCGAGPHWATGTMLVGPWVCGNLMVGYGP